MSLLDKFIQIREENDEPKPFMSHLEEFRLMLIKMAFSLLGGMVVSFIFRKELVNLIQAPLHGVDPSLIGKLQTLGVADSMTISFQLAFYAGLILAFPFLFFFLAQFIVPAMTKQEKKYVFPAIGVGFGLFIFGVLFCYYGVLPQTLAFFFNDAKELNWTPTWTVKEYFSFVTYMLLAFGAAFELPVVVITLVLLNILHYHILASTRPYAIIIIMILAAVISPTPDALTFLTMALPMCLLYEICIWVSWFLAKREERRGIQEAPTEEV